MTKIIEKKRALWLDVLRAMAILFVVIGHTIPKESAVKTIFSVFVGPIMIPLFFAISGYVFNDCGGNQAFFFKRLIRRIIIPSIFLSLIWAKVLLIPFRGVAYFGNEAMRLLSGKECWYISACTIAEVIFFYTRKINKSVLSTCITSFFVFIVGLILAKMDIGNFAMFNRALIAQIYIVMGFLFKFFEKKINEIPGRYVFLGGGIYLLLVYMSLMFWPQLYMDVHQNRYYNLPYCLLMIFVGCFTLFTCGRRLNKAPSFLIYLGQNTLVCYLLHMRCFAIFDKLVSFVGINVTSCFGLKVIKIVFALATCCIIAYVLNKLFPELVGKKRKKQG